MKKDKVYYDVLADTLIIMAADWYKKVYKTQNLGWTAANNTIKDWAEEFTNWWMENTENNTEDTLDFIEEVTDFCDKKYKEMKKLY